MNTLTPTQAVQVALLAYKAKSIKSTTLLNNSLHPSLRGSFNFGVSPEAVQGISGGFFSHLFGLSTGFGLLGHGQGLYQGDSVITIRGTASLRDGLTDAHFGLSGGSNGSMVHAGFNKTFYSMKPALQEFVAANIRDKITGCVHIVGHSLGGALATLSADWIKAEYSLPVKLYTFGSPRVGLDNFSRAATSRIDKIYRCTHGADPVTKVPLWPFSHAPYLILIASPVWGFLPLRAFLRTLVKVPKPTRVTLPFFFLSSLVMLPRKEFTAPAAAALEIPVSLAIFSTSSVLVICSLPGFYAERWSVPLTIYLTNAT